MIDILLPVYNGEKYLGQQIDSILSQSFRDWRLLIRNDGSTDNSQDIIDAYVDKYPNRIININDPKENIGLVESLNCLLSISNSEYIMFSDQDDIWLPDKIELTFSQMIYLETNNPNKPVMVCTDAKCINNDMEVTEDSFFKSMHFIDGVVGNIEKMLALNEVQGCTIMINSGLLKLILPIPKFMKIHDMWIGIYAAKYGVAQYLHHQTMLYRQHGHNVLGAIKPNKGYYWERFVKSWTTMKHYLNLKKTVQFNFSICKVLTYKIMFMTKRLFKNY